MDPQNALMSFNFNNFEGWRCNAGYSGIIIRESDGSGKKELFHDALPGNIETGFNRLKNPKRV